MLVDLLPDLLALLGIIRGVERVVNASDDDQSPRERYQDSIRSQCICMMSLTAGKRIVAGHDEVRVILVR